MAAFSVAPSMVSAESLIDADTGSPFAAMSAESQSASPAYMAEMSALLERSKRAERKAREARKGPEAEGERERSRTAFDQMDDGAAIRLFGNEFARELAPSVTDTETVLDGDRVARFESDFVAVTEGVGDKPARLIDSQVPLRAPETDAPGAKKVPVDLDLVASGDGYAPDAGLARVALPKQSENGIKIGPATVIPEGDASVRRLDSDTLAYPNLDTDTDLAVNVTPTGFETFHQLRGPGAPETQRMKIALPPGSTLRAMDSPIGRGAEVVRDGKQVMAITPPKAIDAQGLEVPSTMTVEGDDTLVVDTPHQGKDLAYPVLVDPQYVVKEDWACGWELPNCTATWWNSFGFALDGLNHWQYTGTGGGTWQQAQNCLRWDGVFNSCYGMYFGGGPYWQTNNVSWSPGKTGLHTWAAQNYTYPSFSMGTHDYIPPGQTTKVYSAEFRHKWYQRATGSHAITMVTGILDSQTGTWAKRPNNDAAADFVNADQGHVTNTIQAQPTQGQARVKFGLVNFSYSAVTAPSHPQAYMGGAIIELTDPEPPTLTTPTPTTSSPNGPDGWAKDNQTFTFAPATGDPGLGVARMYLNAPNRTGSTTSQERGYLCNGSKSKPCPANWTLNPSLPATNPDGTTNHNSAFRINTNDLPEGTNNINITAKDMLGYGGEPGHTSTPSSSTVKVDRTAPALVGEPTGTLYENRNRTDDHRREGLYNDTATIRAEAKDDPNAADNATARSGVKSLELWIDKNRNGTYTSDEKVKEQPTAGCTTSQCPNKGTALEHTIDLGTLSGDGDYNVKIVGRDLSNNSTDLKEWTVTVDRAGDIYNARAYTSNPSGDGEKVVEDWAQYGTFNGRSVTQGHIKTRDAEPCGSSQCGVVRSYFDPPDDAPDTAPRYTTFTAGSPDDSRLEQVTEILDPSHEDLGPVLQSGPIADAMAPWQTAPPAHGADYQVHEITEPEGATGAAANVTRLWIDGTTKMPIKEVPLDEDGAAESPVYYSYDRNRQTAGQAPADLFRVPPPGDTSATRHWDWRDDNVPQDPGEGPDEEDETAMATDFRRTLGLSTDPTVISNLLADPNRDATTENWGTPLTASERQTMGLRVSAANAMGTIQDYGRQQGSRYAGTYIDQANGGLVYVGFTGDASDHLEALRQRFPFPSLIRTFNADFTEAQLDSTASAVSTDKASLAAQGVNVRSISARSRTNRVEVGVENPTPATAAILGNRYGARVEQTQGISPQQAAFRLDGGLAIFRDNPDTPDAQCASGFSARSTGNSERRYFAMTAGHCAGTGRAWYVGRREVGTITFSQHEGNDGNRPEQTRNVDIGYIKLQRRSYRSGFVRGDSPKDRRPIYSYDRYPGNPESGTETNEGQPVCVAGFRFENVHCGEITNESTEAGGLHSIVVAEVNGGGICKGESGGPAYRGGRAVGVFYGFDGEQSDNCGTKVVLTQIEHALNRVNAKLIVRKEP